MTARTRKFLKFANQFLYVLSIAMLISGSFLSAIATPAAAASGPKQTICHFAGGHYNAVDVDISGISNVAAWGDTAHGQHTADIWPAFTLKDGVTVVPAQGDQSIYNNGTCAAATATTPAPTTPAPTTPAPTTPAPTTPAPTTPAPTTPAPTTPAPTTPAPDSPALSIVKTLTPVDHYSVGMTLAYTIVATNTGNVTLNAVTITDPNAVLGTCTPSNPANLAPGATISCAATHAITIGEILSLAFSNTAVATSGALSVNSTVNTTFNPSMALTKEVTSSGPYTLGDTITYKIVATNNGNVSLHWVTVVDPTADSISCTPISTTYLLVGQSMTCTASHKITLADMNAGVVNNTATGDSNETLKVNARASVSLTAGPAISFEKLVTSEGPYGVGDTIQYDLKLTNIGNVTINGLTITDADAGIVMGSCTPALAGLSLDPQASVTCTASHLVTLADLEAGFYTNTATGGSAQTDGKSASATVEFPPLPTPTTPAPTTPAPTTPAPTTPSPVDVCSNLEGIQRAIPEGYKSNGDGACDPIATAVAALPIPATGGQVLIPVTGADLSNTLPGATLPRNLYFGGLSVFGVAMVLTGLRRKYHL